MRGNKWRLVTELDDQLEAAGVVKIIGSTSQGEIKVSVEVFNERTGKYEFRDYIKFTSGNKGINNTPYSFMKAIGRGLYRLGGYIFVGAAAAIILLSVQSFRKSSDKSDVKARPETTAVAPTKQQPTNALAKSTPTPSAPPAPSAAQSKQVADDAPKIRYQVSDFVPEDRDGVLWYSLRIENLGPAAKVQGCVRVFNAAGKEIDQLAGTELSLATGQAGVSKNLIGSTGLVTASAIKAYANEFGCDVDLAKTLSNVIERPIIVQKEKPKPPPEPDGEIILSNASESEVEKYCPLISGISITAARIIGMLRNESFGEIAAANGAVITSYFTDKRFENNGMPRSRCVIHMYTVGVYRGTTKRVDSYCDVSQIFRRKGAVFATGCI